MQCKSLQGVETPEVLPVAGQSDSWQSKVPASETSKPWCCSGKSSDRNHEANTRGHNLVAGSVVTLRHFEDPQNSANHVAADQPANLMGQMIEKR